MFTHDSLVQIEDSRVPVENPHRKMHDSGLKRENPRFTSATPLCKSMIPAARRHTCDHRTGFSSRRNTCLLNENSTADRIVLI